jgi:pre-mRNA-splicing helicase BRR2
VKILADSHVCIATPTQWDAVSRRWRKHQAVQEVSLFVVDELHLLAAEGGHVMEACVSRMRYMSSQLGTGRAVRMVGLSSAVANARQVTGATLTL